MKLSSSLVAMLVGLAAASPLANPSYAGRASIAKRYDKAQIDSEIKKLGDLIADMQKTKDEKVAEKVRVWRVYSLSVSWLFSDALIPTGYL